jgi:hypothetical protein
MNLYVWPRIEHASDNYHHEGGVVVIAESLPEAVAMAASEGAMIRDDEQPAEIRDVNGPPVCWVFIDAGCC